MAKQKKKDSCLVSAIKLPLFLVVLGILINVGGALVNIAAVIGIVLLFFGAAYLIFLLIRWMVGLRSPLGNINFDSMNGQEFENFCAKVLRNNGFSSVAITQGSGDHGIDILANKNGMKYAIQCKCYSDNVGNKAVQEAYSGKAIYRADIAVVMTNRYFTKQAQSDARSLSVQLWDRNKLKNLICFADKRGNEDVINNDVKHEDKDEPEIIKEKIYGIKNITIQFSLSEENKISILIIDAKDEIELSCVFFYFYIELRDKHKEISNYTISTVYQGKTVNCENEYIYGHNSDGTISRTTPDWLEKARKDLLEIGIQNYSDIISGIDDAINDFIVNDFENENTKEEKCEMRHSGTNTDRKIHMPEVSAEYDYLIFEAGKFIIEKNKASIGMIQREFKIGFSRAARIMDELCEIGVVGYESGTQPRKILMTPEEFENILKNPELIKEKEYNVKNNIQEIEENKVDENDLRNTCMIMNAIILETYKSFGVDVRFDSFKFEDGNAVFGIVPNIGVRVKTVMNYEKDLSLRLGTEVKIKLLTGYIGIFIPILQFKNRTEEMLKDSRFTEYYKMCSEEKQEVIEDDTSRENI